MWNTIEKALTSGYRLSQPVSKYMEIFSNKQASLYGRMVKELRNTKGFHFNREHFEEWIQKLNAPEVTLWHKDGSSPMDWAFTASLQIQSFYGVQLDKELMFDLRHAADLVFLVEALGCGLVLEAGRDPLACWRPTRYQQVRIEYQFRDGRPSVTERMVVAVDAGGGLAGTGVGALLQKFHPTFGGREHTGFVLFPADGGVMLFNSARFGARVASVDTQNGQLIDTSKPAIN